MDIDHGNDCYHSRGVGNQKVNDATQPPLAMASPQGEPTGSRSLVRLMNEPAAMPQLPPEHRGDALQDGLPFSIGDTRCETFPGNVGFKECRLSDRPQRIPGTASKRSSELRRASHFNEAPGSGKAGGGGSGNLGVKMETLSPRRLAPEKWRCSHNLKNTAHRGGVDTKPLATEERTKTILAPV